MPLGIAAFANFGRCRDIDFTERIIGDPARRSAIFARGRNRGDYRNLAVPRQMCRDFGQPPNVFATIRGRETEIAIEAGAQCVAVEQYGRTAIAEQLAFERSRQGRFA